MNKKLEVIVDPAKPTIITHRELDAPRELVWEAWTKPELVKRWLGPRAHTMTVCEIDLRVGGKYRWVFRTPDGREVSFHGEFREIVRPERLVSTFIFDAYPDEEAIDTLTLVERDGKTIATTFSVHRSIAARDGHVQGGMERGMSEGYERLDELLAQ